MAGKILATYEYTPAKVEKGYAGKTLYINLSDMTIKEKPVTEKMKELFVGGRGFGLWYLWNAVSSDTKWNDPENEIIIAGGPICGITQYPGSGKAAVVTLSPLTGCPMDNNVGGYFAPLLKFSGWDALEIQGKSDRDVIVFIDGNRGKVVIEDASDEPADTHLLAEKLTERYADSEEDKRNISVVSSGKGAENTLIGMLNVSFYDVKRKAVRVKQAGRGGSGTVFRDKKIKAIVVKYKGVTGDSNNPADKEKIINAALRLHKEIFELDKLQNRMREVGTANLVEVMNDYDLLPVMNFQYGSHPDANRITSKVFREKYFTQNVPDNCWYGCSLSCAKAVDNYEVKTGPYKGQKVCVDAAEYETIAAVAANCGIFDPEYVIEANFYCDTYGLDTISFGNIVGFAMECYERGIINKEITGGLELKFGNADAALELLHQMAKGEGFGKIAGQGVKRLREYILEKTGADAKLLRDISMEIKGLEVSMYVSKESLAQQGGYAFANKGPQHDEAWLIFMDMVNKQIPTFEDKAEALHYFPIFRTWFSLQGLCKLPWNDIVPADNAMTDEPHKIPAHVQNYVDLFNGVTGKNITKEELLLQSERVFNFQRIFNLKMGKGTREYDMPPFRLLGPATKEEYESRAERYDKQLKELGYDIEGKTTEEKMAMLRQYRESQFEKLVDAVYKRRGWNKNGVPTLETVKKLGIDFPDVVELIAKYQV